VNVAVRELGCPDIDCTDLDGQLFKRFCRTMYLLKQTESHEKLRDMLANALTT
jgi:hypothetical protein